MNFIWKTKASFSAKSAFDSSFNFVNRLFTKTFPNFGLRRSFSTQNTTQSTISTNSLYNLTHPSTKIQSSQSSTQRLRNNLPISRQFSHLKPSACNPLLLKDFRTFGAVNRCRIPLLVNNIDQRWSSSLVHRYSSGNAIPNITNKDMEGILLGIGNPLLDISVHNVGKHVLERYNLKSGDAVMAHVSDHKIMPLFDELSSFPNVYVTAGGAAQNTIRAAQWMLQVPDAAAFIGCIGKDHHGETLQKAALNSGIKTHYMIKDSAKTGICAVLISADSERSLVAHLGAAEHYHRDHFESDEIQKVVQRAKYFYSEAFFLVVSPDTLLSIGRHSSEQDKHFLLNLSAPFLIENEWDRLESLLPFTDVVICNESEAATVGKKLNIGDFYVIAKHIAEIPKANKKRKRIVIFTQGVKPTLVYIDGKMDEFPITPVDPSELVDTNGAGDSFVGGFLSGYVQGLPLRNCIERGHYCARECVKHHGATFPPLPILDGL